MINLRPILVLLLLFGASTLSAQYTMRNGMVSDCEGTLTDSEVGNADHPTGYDHNENYTFTVCVPGASSVTITFSFFELEKTSSGNVSLDILSIYQGAGRTGPLIGEYTGDQNPGTITINDSCFTIHFVSDASVNAEGWNLEWEFVPPPRVAPNLLPIANVPCESESVIVRFDQGIACSQVRPQNFGFNGPTGSIADVQPINCTNDTTSEVLITFNGPLDESGNYTVSYNLVYFDICGNPYQFNNTATFSIVDCPLEVEIVGDTTVCEGQCTFLTAQVTGGDINNYQFSWTPAAANSATIQYCPAGPPADSISQVIVTVTDGNSIPASDTITVVRLPNPTVGADFSVCRFDPDTILTGTPSGGNWVGPGMNGQGRFRPAAAGAGTHTVTYFAPNGCPANMDITVHQVNTPNYVSMCNGADSVFINAIPTGGTWAGSNNITTTGYYSAGAAGRDTITYTEPNFGCTKQTAIEIVDSVIVPTYDSILKCTNEQAFNLNFTPPGGTWNGNAVNNNGRFNPGNAGAGFHVLYYTIPGGCQDSTSVEVFDIYAGTDTILCPDAGAFVLNSGFPAGGIWSGNGVSANGDSSIYTFNTNQFNGADTSALLRYELSGCSDFKQVFLIRTAVENQRFDFCEYDAIEPLPLSALNQNPAGGNWFGTGYNNDSIDVQALNPGANWVYYEFQNNGCLDSVQVNVNPKPSATTPAAMDTVCRFEVDFDLNGTPAGGTWSGIGIVDANQGTFSPTSIGFNGSFQSFYNLNGCSDTTVVVIRDLNPNITGLAPVYCFQYGNPIDITGTPAGGTFTGNGITDAVNGTFEPGVAGSGNHLIQYIVGTGLCEYRDSAFVLVQDTLVIDSIVGRDAICFGETTVIEAFVSGGPGIPARYEYSWTPNDFGGSDPKRITVGPDTSTTYTLTVRDRATNYCSYTTTGTFDLTVHPEIEVDAQPGPSVCFGEDNFANLYALSNNPQSYTWYFRGNVVGTGPYYEGPAGNYNVRVVDEVTNCSIDIDVELPQFPYLNAEILVVPATNEISIENPSVFIVNSTVGATGGSWDIRDQDTSVTVGFTPGDNFELHFPDTGDYVIKLVVFNGGGLCSDSVTFKMKVAKIVTVFIPNAFTPNRDGDNDVWPNGQTNDFGNWTPKGYDLIDFEVSIHNRWGEQVFSTERVPNAPWNGNYFNRTNVPCEPGVYSYRAKLFFDEFNHQTVMGTITLLR